MLACVFHVSAWELEHLELMELRLCKPVPLVSSPHSPHLSSFSGSICNVSETMKSCRVCRFPPSDWCSEL